MFMDEAEQENEIKVEEARIKAEEEKEVLKKRGQAPAAVAAAVSRGLGGDIRAVFRSRVRTPADAVQPSFAGEASGAAGGAGAGGGAGGGSCSNAQRRRTEDLESSKRQREFFEFLQVSPFRFAL